MGRFARWVLKRQSEEPSMPAEVKAEKPSSSFRAVMSSATFFRSAKDLISSAEYPACSSRALL